MALTIAKVANADRTEGNKRVRVRTVTFDSSYATGGEALAASDFGLRAITELRPNGAALHSDGTKAVAVGYDYTNGKLLAYWYNGASTGKSQLLEVDSTTDLSAYSVRVTAVGY